MAVDVNAFVRRFGEYVPDFAHMSFRVKGNLVYDLKTVKPIYFGRCHDVFDVIIDYGVVHISGFCPYETLTWDICIDVPTTDETEAYIKFQGLRYPLLRDNGMFRCNYIFHSRNPGFAFFIRNIPDSCTPEDVHVSAKKAFHPLFKNIVSIETRGHGGTLILRNGLMGIVED